MRLARICLSAGIAGVVAVAVPYGTAGAASPNPSGAMKKSLVTGRGVAFTETSKSWIGADRSDSTGFRVKGVLSFGKGRLAGGDITRVVAGGGKKFRFILAGGVTYAQGGAWTESLPSGKTWVRNSDLKMVPYQLSEQNVNIFEPAALQAMFATATGEPRRERVKGVSATLYSGTVSAKALCGVSAACREAFGRSSTVKISWRVWLDGGSRVIRLVTGWSQKTDAKRGVVGGGSRVDTYYTRWGARVVVKAPPVGAVARL